jgi:hypothetical protein
VDPEKSSLLDEQKKPDGGHSNQPQDDEKAYHFSSGSESSASIENIRSGLFQAHVHPSAGKTSPLKVIRHHTSPFANIGKSTEKADRRRFLPQTSSLGNEGEKTFPTYICPACKTRQREFYSVTNAPRQFESASGYIAFYFGIYVIAALYIFGLQVRITLLLSLASFKMPAHETTKF